MWRCFIFAALVFFGCHVDESGPLVGSDVVADFVLSPAIGGRGTTIDVFFDAARPDFLYGETDFDFGEGIDVESVTVLDSYNAMAVLNIEANAELGLRDVTIYVEDDPTLLTEAFQIIAESFVIDPDNAKLGELLDVAIVGRSTDWVEGIWASFGDGIDVISFSVLSPTLAAATISVRPDTAPGLRNVTIENGPDVLTLHRGFTVDRSVVTAFFEPEEAMQGETVDFTIRGLNTNFTDGSTIEFWDMAGKNSDIVVREIHVLDSENMYGRIQLSNAAAIGFRDVMIRAYEDILVPDGLEVLDAPPDYSSVAVGLGFDVSREIDDATGDLLESVSALAYFVIPLDPPCGAPPPMGDGPKPYDNNGVFATPPPAATVDCPNPETVSAGDYVWFESPENIVTLHKEIISSTGQTIYIGHNLTLDDYRFGQMYDLHTQGDPNGIEEVLIEEVQPTVPADYYLLTPELWGGYTHDRVSTFEYTWTPALTYPTAIFSTSINGTLAENDEGGFAGCLPWDDGVHEYSPSELLLLNAGPVSFSMMSYVEGPYFGLPFSAIQTNQSDSALSTTARLVLE
ncbi:MAG: hypothetical protein HN348_22750 [Proteobacteria bacterium]|nr:hypothetical protein [Pseudomonadota bacterium]